MKEKYLDRKDIEKEKSFINGGYQIETLGGQLFKITKGEEKIFYGILKNKTDLKKVLNARGI